MNLKMEAINEKSNESFIIIKAKLKYLFQLLIIYQVEQREQQRVGLGLGKDLHRPSDQ